MPVEEQKRIACKLLPLDEGRKKDIAFILAEATTEQADFRGVMVIALVEYRNQDQAIRTYYSGLNRLERKGLLDEARDLVE